jgi:hypothetical protein
MVPVLAAAKKGEAIRMATSPIGDFEFEYFLGNNLLCLLGGIRKIALQNLAISKVG